MAYRVLFVDDEPALIEGMKAALFQEPYEVLGATNPREALALLTKEPVDVVVSDEVMPEMTGAELLSRVRKLQPATIRIILTGHGTFATALTAINDGAVYRYLLKPVATKTLVETIREGLRDKIEADYRDKVWNHARAQHAALAGYAEATDGALGAPHGIPSNVHSSPEAASPWAILSEREAEIARAIVDGQDAKAIARATELSLHTVRNHLKAIYRKLQVHSRLELFDLLYADARGAGPRGASTPAASGEPRTRSRRES